MLAETLLALAVASASPDVEKSVAILFGQSADGGMSMLCTATRTEVNGERLWLTAAHCVSEADQQGKDKVVETPLFLSTDERDTKAYVRAEIVRVGRRDKGYDFALLRSPSDVPPILLGEVRDESDHAPIVNIAAPLGIGRVAFFGNIAMKYIDRPLIEEESKINWRGGMLVSVPSEGGSSGSAIVSRDTRRIVGILVGHFHSLVIAIPASRVTDVPDDMIMFPAPKPQNAAAK